MLKDPRYQVDVPKDIIGRREAYRNYIKSNEWREKSKAVRGVYTKCWECGSTKNLQVHHNNYENIGKERLEDLSVVCEECHKALEHRKKQIKKLKQVTALYN